MQELIKQLQNVPDNDVLIGDSISEKYQHDWSADAPGIPGAVVRPSSTQALSESLMHQTSKWWCRVGLLA
jgi:hypothetical protein